MTATERLRQLLDERGVEWQERVWGGKHSVTTFWCARGVRWHYRENRFDELRLHADGLTPEQAVEATLGRGTCKMEATLTNPFETRIDEYHCSECGEYCSVEKVMGKTEPPKFCPECGRRVEE